MMNFGGVSSMFSISLVESNFSGDLRCIICVSTKVCFAKGNKG